MRSRVCEYHSCTGYAWRKQLWPDAARLLKCVTPSRNGEGSVDASQSPMTGRTINDLRKARYVPWPSDSCNAFDLRGPTHQKIEVNIGRAWRKSLG
jgi:hypothetical protein